MKKFLVGAVATAALLTPAIASADTNAVVGVQAGNTDFDGGDFDHYGLNGGFSHDFSNGWTFQFDGDHSRLSGDGDPDLSTGYGAAHMAMRNDTYALGGFVSMDEFFALSGTGFGVEGQYYLNNVVVGGSLGVVSFDDADIGATSLQLDGAYFFSPNLSVNALIAQTEGNDDIDEDWTSWGIGGEYRLSASPISIAANWRNDEFDGYDADTWTIGVNFDFGTGSLHERATNGPSLQGARNLHESFGNIL